MTLKELLGKTKAAQLQKVYGITTVEQAQEYTDEQLLKVHFVGLMAVHKIRNAIPEKIVILANGRSIICNSRFEAADHVLELLKDNILIEVENVSRKIKEGNHDCSFGMGY